MKYRFLIRMIHGLIWLIAAYRLGDWKNWKKYYPTILFFSLGDALYNLVFHNKKLWSFNDDTLAVPFHELYVMITIFSSTALIFLSHYPEKLGKRMRYIVMWAAIYTGIEVIMYYFDMIRYSYGWNIWWSMFFDICLFSLLSLHHRNPLLAWVVVFIFLGIMMNIFNVPFLL